MHTCLLSCVLQNENAVKYVSEIKASLKLVENLHTSTYKYHLKYFYCVCHLCQWHCNLVPACFIHSEFQSSTVPLISSFFIQNREEWRGKIREKCYLSPISFFFLRLLVFLPFAKHQRSEVVMTRNIKIES